MNSKATRCTKATDCSNSRDNQPSEIACYFGQCTPLNCNESLDCLANGWGDSSKCINSRCSISCSCSEDCGGVVDSGLECRGGVCHYNLCSTTNDCLQNVGDNFLCVQGHCRSNVCRHSADCQKILVADKDGASVVGLNFECVQGRCSNNPYRSGCLVNTGKLPPGSAKKRVCNSDDPPDAESLGFCRKSPFDYMEVRIFAIAWESSIAEAWMLQIVLSEILDIPTTIEYGVFRPEMNFHVQIGDASYGRSSDWMASKVRRNTAGVDAFVVATDVKDCRLVSRQRNEYQVCAHFSPDAARARESEWGMTLIRDKVVEPPQAAGSFRQQAWFIPQFTALRYPSFQTWHGLSGDANRRNLAKAFKRPTTWGDYCQQVSLNNCTVDDGVARRAPMDLFETERMFVEGLYTGHFRDTVQNDCDSNPLTCTGHFAEFPCGMWFSYFPVQSLYLDIALESNGNADPFGGYTMNQVQEIWEAANATKSNVIMQWWSPDIFFQKFLGTDAEFSQVVLPPNTEDCELSRAEYANTVQCYENRSAYYRDASASVCEISPHTAQKVLARGLAEATQKPSIPEGLRHPANDVFDLFYLSTPQVGSMVKYWLEKETERDAICDWVVDHYESVKQIIPFSYPRRLVEAAQIDVLMCVTIFAAFLAISSVLWTSYMVYRYRNIKSVKTAQVEFLGLLLAGLLLISVGALTAGVPHTKFSCMATEWLGNMGYTIALVPLIMKVAAINRLSNAAHRMKRVVMSKIGLIINASVVLLFLVMFLITWAIMDPVLISPEFKLTDQIENDETIVDVEYYCQHDTWQNYAMLGWTSIMLLVATVYAFEMRKVKSEFNESSTLGFMIYSHFVFMAMRVGVCLFPGELNNIISECYSIICSVDVVSTICIYFLPKLTKNRDFATPTQSVFFVMKGGLNTSENCVEPFQTSGNSFQIKRNTRKVNMMLEEANVKAFKSAKFTPPTLEALSTVERSYTLSATARPPQTKLKRSRSL